MAFRVRTLKEPRIIRVDSFAVEVIVLDEDIAGVHTHAEHHGFTPAAARVSSWHAPLDVYGVLGSCRPNCSPLSEYSGSADPRFSQHRPRC